MRVLVCAATLALSLAATALAHQVGVEEGRTITVRVTRADCARLVEHVPAPDVAYRPGVDVRGRPVVPPDLGGTRVRPPEVIEIDIEVDLTARFGVPATPDLFDPDAEIGTVTYRDGRFYFNGQLLQDEELAILSAACQRIRKGP